MDTTKWHLCEKCISYLKSRGTKLYKGDLVFSADDTEYGEEEQKCDWCEEVNDLYECIEP